MRTIKVYGTVNIYDENFTKIHSATMMSRIAINEDDGEDEWTAANLAADMWLQMFKGMGNVEVEETWT